MRAYQVVEQSGMDGLKAVELPTPKPGWNQILVKVSAASLNDFDRMILTGQYPFKLQLPLIPLRDGVGEVVELGAGATRFQVGDRVAGNFLPRWISGALTAEMSTYALASTLPGYLAEYIVLEAEGTVKVPSSLSTIEAATLPSAALTAWQALSAQGDVRPGETILVQGTSAVSLFALQFAKALGAQIILTTGGSEQANRGRALGADATLNYRDEDWAKQVLDLTQGQGVDLVLEMGGRSLLNSIDCTKLGGRIAIVATLAPGAVELDPLLFIAKRLTMFGILSPGSRAMFEAMNAAIEAHQIRPVVDRVFRFGEAHEAFEYFLAKQYFGKVCITVSD